MKQEIRFAGYGGQGVILAAVILAEAAGLYENKEVAQTQSYGPEARGALPERMWLFRITR